MEHKGSISDLNKLISELRAEGYDVLGPVDVNGNTRFERIEDIRDVNLMYIRAVPPPVKAALLPPRERILTWRRGEIIEEETEKKIALLAIHPCDLASRDILDRVYLREPVDPYYESRRKNLFLIVLNCTRCDEYCFCNTFGTGPRATEGFDIAITMVGEKLIFEAGSDRGMEMIGKIGLDIASREDEERAREAVDTLARTMGKAFNIMRVEKDMKGSLFSSIWNRLGERCIACGSCSLVCPTCFCFNIVDGIEDDLETRYRERIWTSCLLYEFSEVALGGHFRREVASRIRQFMNHKLNYWIDQFGVYGCVGCGRCIENCPAEIDIRKVALEAGGCIVR